MEEKKIISGRFLKKIYCSIIKCNIFSLIGLKKNYKKLKISVSLNYNILS